MELTDFSSQRRSRFAAQLLDRLTDLLASPLSLCGDVSAQELRIPVDGVFHHFIEHFYFSNSLLDLACKMLFGLFKGWQVGERDPVVKKPLLETEPLRLTKRLFIDIRMLKMKGFPLLLGTFDYLYNEIFFEYFLIFLILNCQCFWLTSLLRS